MGHLTMSKNSDCINSLKYILTYTLPIRVTSSKIITQLLTLLAKYLDFAKYITQN